MNDGGVPLHPVKEYYLHLLTSVFAFIECLYLHRPFASMKQGLGGLIGLTLLYVGWWTRRLSYERCAVWDESPRCLRTALSIPKRYGSGMRVGFYTAAVLGFCRAFPVGSS